MTYLHGILTAATDEAADLFPRLLRPEEGPVPAETPGRASRFGLRLGLLLPTSVEDGSWESAARAGLYYRSGRRTAFEIGIDHASLAGVAAPGQTVASKITFLRFDALFGLAGGGGSGAGLFLLGGAELGLEKATWEATGDAADRKSGGLNVGVGLGPRSGRWDARVVYSIFVGSDNAAGSLTTTVGYAF